MFFARSNAEAFVDVLVAEGIDLAAGFPGTGTAPLIAALRGEGRIRSVLVRQERVAVEMADGYARASGRLALSFASSGPGAAGAVAGIAQAHADRVPLLHVQGQVTGGLAGPRVTQRVDTAGLLGSVARAVILAQRPEGFLSAVRRALRLLRSPPGGPVVLEVDDDLWQAAAPGDSSLLPWVPVAPVRSAGDPLALRAAASALGRADRPLIYAGAGAVWAGAAPGLRALAERLGAPVATTLNAKGLFPEDHPLALGLGGFPSGTYSTPLARWFARRADAVLAVGNSFKEFASGRRAWPQGVTLVHVTADPAELDRVHPAAVPVLGDAALVVEQLAEELGVIPGAGERRAAVERRIAGLREDWQRRWAAELLSPQRPISPYRLLGEMTRVFDPRQTVMLHDAGSVRGYFGHLYPALLPRGFLGMGGQSAMGWSLGAAMGAKLARPEMQVVHVLGDGSLGMVGTDLETAARTAIPIITVVLNNRMLGVTRMDQPRGGEHMVAIGGDYRALARSLGVAAERIEEPERIRPALETALAESRSGRPFLLEVLVREAPLPTIRRGRLSRAVERSGLRRV